MALLIPTNEAAMLDLVDPNQEEANLLSITQRYSDPNAFQCMLARIGCDVKERFRIIHDGFDTIESLVDHFNDDI
jgi:hypothetical protein